MLIGMAGLAGSGKDTAADWLAGKWGFQKVAFADPMKRFVSELWGLAPDVCWGPSKNREALLPGTETTARRALQLLGTEWGRACDPNVWVNYTIRKALEHEHCVISDVRFDNEASKIKQAGGFVIQLLRAGSGLQGAAATHASERPLTVWDHCILNDCEKAFLYASLDATLRDLGLRLKPVPCWRCDGEGSVPVECAWPGDVESIDARVTCPVCEGK